MASIQIADVLIIALGIKGLVLRHLCRHLRGKYLLVTSRFKLHHSLCSKARALID
jgi:hypothetical protein